MELILTKDVENVGKKGDVVRVRDGHARNFLIPQNLAVAATRANRQFVEETRERARVRKEKEKTEAQETAKRLADLKVTIEAKSGDNDKLFGSVTADEICDAINQKGHQFKKKQIHLKEAIRSLGKFSVTVDVYPEVKGTVTIEVVNKTS